MHKVEYVLVALSKTIARATSDFVSKFEQTSKLVLLWEDKPSVVASDANAPRRRVDKIIQLMDDGLWFRVQCLVFRVPSGG